ncbi:MAG: (d)CMP kinase [Armatimonadota bacterium]|nr:(d)CMP kinase [Armatimonadota bacterium]MDR5697212.1 (d)CMP kinase [Armatimonadota bacterium]
MRRPMTIAIDGPMGAGKGTIARLLAQRLGYRYVDTGAMYRAIAWKALQTGVDLHDRHAVAELARHTQIRLEPAEGGMRVMCDGEDVTAAIRSLEVNAAVSAVASNPGVRSVLTERQRQLALSGGLVMEGRDIGTVVLPHADLKIYLDASLDERARRRWEELRDRGEDVPLDEVKEILRRDDEVATAREVAPLRRAPDAHRIDTTGKTPEQVIEEILGLARNSR